MQTTDPQLAKSIRTTSTALILTVDECEWSVPWAQCSPRLRQATDEERQQAELSPGGYGVHWKKIDEDLSVAGLLSRARH